MYSEKTTQAERIAISNAVCGIISDIEDAQNLLETVIEECFFSAKPKRLDDCEVAWVSSMLRIIRNNIHNSISEYYLTIADGDYPSVERYIGNAEQVKRSIECNEIYNEICNSERFMDIEKRKISTNARMNIAQMDDDVAIAELKLLLQKPNKT